MRYAIRRVSPLGALFYGLVMGMAIWLLPGVFLGWLARSLVLGLRDWLSGLSLTIPLPIGEGISIDLTSALQLASTQERLTALAGQDVALFLAVALGAAAAGMLLTGLSAFLGALFYNLFAGLFGGVEVSLDALDSPNRHATPQEAPRPSAAKSPRPTINPATTAAPVAAARPRPARPPSVAWLASAGNAHERWALRDDATRIGSSSDNDIVLPGLAPYHAEIRRESDRYLVYDLGSRRTWVNDAQVAAVHMLKNGFRLQMGQAEFVVHISAVGSSPEDTQ